MLAVMRAWLVVVVAACTSSPPVIENRAPSPPDRWPAWGAVVPGAVFVLHSSTITIAGTVTAVEPQPDRRIIHVTWTRDGAPLEAGSRELTLPTTITLGPTTVTFDGMGGGNGEFPISTDPAPVDRDAPWARRYGEAVCYGDGPHSAAACEDDACGFDAFCVDARRGIVGGWGEWWPDGQKFERR